MEIHPPLQKAVLIKRYKRFLTDLRLHDGSVLTVHCPNTGSMRNCSEPGKEAWYSESDNPNRKYPHTFEVVQVEGSAWAGINTARANHLVREAIENGVVDELQGYSELRAEVPYGEEKSRIDFLLQREGRGGVEKCFVEVKNVTLGMGAGLGLFPDAVTTRGTKHLRELIAMVEQGHRGVLLFCVQHTGIDWVEPADDIDPVYGEMLRLAVAAGVEVLAYKAKIAVDCIALTGSIPVVLEVK